MNRNLRVFLDSNVLFSAAAGSHSDFRLFWTIPNVDILTSAYSIAEVSRNLRSSQDRAGLWRLIYSSHLVPDGEAIELPPEVRLVAKDAPILKSAIAGEADLLLTGDRNHFGAFYGETISGVRIELPRSFKMNYPHLFPGADKA